MVNNDALDDTFRALCDRTRRQIINMLTEQKQHRIKDLAAPFDISLAAISKHIRILERARLVTRIKRGREYYLQLNTEPMREAKDWLAFYERFWLERFAHMEQLLQHQQNTTKEKADGDT